ncbi:MAG: quinolinate synthase NadA [Candidatus Altiarchaeota archaeon]|nr:quinolinate synthase NadA [Candidatus Altiarchaeota archaeon]
MKDPAEEIRELKKERNAVILAHNYQRPEIQDIADFIGDSLALSREAIESRAGVIVFCGVDFMAQTAAIMNPEKTVLLPDTCSMCPMALMLRSGDLKAAKAKHPDAKCVLYINSSADTKALADCVCTSANAAGIVNAMDSDTVIFGPDRNLAYFVRKRTDKKIIAVPEYGVCPTHHQISEEDALKALKEHPGAELVVHPEVTPEVQELAAHITSTEGMIDYCRRSPAKGFIIGTEEGMLYRLQKEVPEKDFYPVSGSTVCPPMKMTTLEKVRDCLRNMGPKVEVTHETAARARKAIDCMLRISP